MVRPTRISPISWCHQNLTFNPRSHVLPNATLYFITPLCLSQYYTTHALRHPQLYRSPRLGWFCLSWMHGCCIAAQPRFLCIFWKPAGLGRDPHGTSLNGELIICTGFSSLHRRSSPAGCNMPEPTRWCWDYGQYLTRHLLFRHRGHTSPKCCSCICPSCSDGLFLLAPHIPSGKSRFYLNLLIVAYIPFKLDK